MVTELSPSTFKNNLSNASWNNAVSSSSLLPLTLNALILTLSSSESDNSLAYSPSKLVAVKSVPSL